MATENKITAGTISRTIILVIALVNQLLTATGHPVIPVADEQVTELISVAFTIVTAIVAWWKNNSFTKAARDGDALMKAEKK